MPVYEDKKAKNKNKRFYVNVYYTDEFGKRQVVKKRGFATKTAAREAETEIKHALNNATYTKPNKIKMSQLASDWIADKKGTIKEETWEQYEIHVRCRIIPKLGDYVVTSLTQRHLQDFFNHYKENQTLSSEGIKKMYTIINAILERAVDWGTIPKNAAKKIELPKVEKSKPVIWTMEEAWRFLKAAREDRYYCVFLLALATGMRQGELLGIKLNEIDYTNRLIRVENPVKHNGKGFEKRPKTRAGERHVSLDEFTLKEIRKQHNRMLKEKLESIPESYADYGLLFPTSKGTAVRPRNIVRTFERLIKKSGVKKIKFHELRHSHATFLLELDQHPKKVAERLGHADSRMMDRYSHVQPHVEKQTADTFGESFYSTVSS